MIEMMVVIAIIGILSATSVGNYGSFRSATVATNMGYEAAATLRQAQLYGLGVRVGVASGPQSDTYGVEFSAGSSAYSIFRDEDTGPGANAQCADGGCDGHCGGAGDPCNCGDPDSECVEQVRMLQQVEVMALCAFSSPAIDTPDLLASYCNHQVLSATFTRPNPESVVRATAVAGGTPSGPPGDADGSYGLGGIVIRGGGHCRLVRVYENGQLSVEGLSTGPGGDVDGTQFEDECTGA